MNIPNKTIRLLIGAMTEARETLPGRTPTGDHGETPMRDTLELVLDELIEVFTAALEPELQYRSPAQSSADAEG